MTSLALTRLRAAIRGTGHRKQARRVAALLAQLYSRQAPMPSIEATETDDGRVFVYRWTIEGKDVVLVSGAGIEGEIRLVPMGQKVLVDEGNPVPVPVSIEEAKELQASLREELP